MKKQRNFKFSEHVMDMLRELAKENGMSNTATLEMMIIQAHKEMKMNIEETVLQDFGKIILFEYDQDGSNPIQWSRTSDYEDDLTKEQARDIAEKGFSEGGYSFHSWWKGKVIGTEKGIESFKFSLDFDYRIS